MTIAGQGVRERKRQETRQRIADAGLRLFGTRGYEATTLDAIAAEAGISRRTFFHYFKSKEDILLSMQSGLGERVARALALEAPGREPLAAARAAIKTLVLEYAPGELLAIDRLMRSSEAVRSRKQASYIEDEAAVFAAMRELWPAHGATELRVLAMLTVSTSRLALDTWSAEGGTRPLAEYVDAYFDALPTPVAQR